MELWRVSVVDGHFNRYAGFAVVSAPTAEEARDVVTHYLANDTAYAKPYAVSEVQRHDHPDPHVLFFNWGEWDEWPLRRDTPDPSGA